MGQVQIRLDANDLGQMIDGIEILLAQWEATARYHSSGEVQLDEFVHEASSLAEAEYLVRTYRRLLECLRLRMESSSST